MPILFLYLALFIVALCGLFATLLIFASALTVLIVKVPFAPTPQKVVDMIMNELKIKKGDIFYDLGCGGGRFLIAAHKRGADAIGFEVSPWVYARARLNLMLNNCPAKIYYKNFYNTDISDANAINCFLITKVMPKVEKKILKEVKPGTVFSCYGFKMPNLRPEKIIKPNASGSSMLYIYTKR